MNPVLDFIREFLAAHPNVANALALLVTAIIGAVLASLGIGDPGADVARSLVP